MQENRSYFARSGFETKLRSVVSQHVTDYAKVANYNRRKMHLKSITVLRYTTYSTSRSENKILKISDALALRRNLIPIKCLVIQNFLKEEGKFKSV